MAAATAITTFAEVQLIPLEQLEASLKNPRRTMNEADLKELAASIREHGLQVPLLVRPIRFDCGNSERQAGFDYEIVCGHRRSEAATIAGLSAVPCMVRELSDEQAAEIALIDNLQRVDVPPLEAFVLFTNQFHDSTRANFYDVDDNKGVGRKRESLWKLAKSVGVDPDAVATEYFHHRNDATHGHASIAPAEDILLPKGYKPPKEQKPAAKPSKKPILSSEARKRIEAAQKKRWAAQRAKKGGSK
jgi:ParB/RepB/Spo0J family partition protein